MSTDLPTCHDHYTHSQITILCVWINVQITLECEEIHQVTKYYEANF